MNGITIGQIITICIAIFSLISTYRFRYIDRKRKKFYYIIRNRTIIEKTNEKKDIEIKYKNEETDKLIQTDILIFNKGNKTIKYEELGKVTGMQLAFSKQTRIFDWKIIEYNNPNVNFICEANDNIINLKFDYFKSGNFIKIEINTDEKLEKYPNLLCEFINEDRILEFSDRKFRTNELKISIPVIMFFILLLIFILDYFNPSEGVKIIICLVSGCILVDILRYFMNKEIDNRIKEMILE